MKNRRARSGKILSLVFVAAVVGVFVANYLDAFTPVGQKVLVWQQRAALAYVNKEYLEKLKYDEQRAVGKNGR